MKIRALMQKLQFPILQYQRLNAIQFLENNIVKITLSKAMQLFLPIIFSLFVKLYLRNILFLTGVK